LNRNDDLCILFDDLFQHDNVMKNESIESIYNYIYSRELIKITNNKLLNEYLETIGCIKNNIYRYFINKINTITNNDDDIINYFQSVIELLELIPLDNLYQELISFDKITTFQSLFIYIKDKKIYYNNLHKYIY
jgi:hypothetical protein